MRRTGDEAGAGSEAPPPRPPAAERRPEDIDTARAIAAKLGLTFLLKVYCRVSPALRTEAGVDSLSQWRANMCKLVALRRIAWMVLCEFHQEAYLGSHLQQGTPPELKEAVLEIFGEACRGYFLASPVGLLQEAEMDSLAQWLVCQLYDSQAALPPTAAPAEQLRVELDAFACFDAYAAILERNHSARRVLLDGGPSSRNLLNFLFARLVPRGLGSKQSAALKPSAAVTSMLTLAAILLLSTEGCCPDGAPDPALPNPLIRVPPGKQPYPWPAAATPQVVQNLLHYVPQELAMTAQSPQRSSTPRFFRLIMFLTWNHAANTVTVLNHVLNLLNRDSADDIEAYQVAVVEMFSVQDNLAQQRIQYLLRPHLQDSEPGLLQQISDLARLPNEECIVAVAMIRILVALADAHPPATTLQVRTAVGRVQPGQPPSLPWSLDQLQHVRHRALDGWTNPSIAERFAWAADPAICALLERAQQLCPQDGAQPGQ